jgi:hypothetical protein
LLVLSAGGNPGSIQWLRNPDAKHLKDRWFPNHNDPRTRAWLRSICDGDLGKFDWITNLVDALGIPRHLRHHFVDEDSDGDVSEAENSEGEDESSAESLGGDVDV